MFIFKHVSNLNKNKNNIQLFYFLDILGFSSSLLISTENGMNNSISYNVIVFIIIYINYK